MTELGRRRVTLLSIAQDCFDRLTRNAWEPGQKVVHARATFKIFEERFHRHARSLEEPFTADFAGNALYSGALCSIEHDRLSIPGNSITSAATRYPGKNACSPVAGSVSRFTGAR
jgi:hypothetical protein